MFHAELWQVNNIGEYETRAVFARAWSAETHTTQQIRSRHRSSTTPEPLSLSRDNADTPWKKVWLSWSHQIHSCSLLAATVIWVHWISHNMRHIRWVTNSGRTRKSSVRSQRFDKSACLRQGPEEYRSSLSKHCLRAEYFLVRSLLAASKFPSFHERFCVVRNRICCHLHLPFSLSLDLNLKAVIRHSYCDVCSL